MIKRISTLLLLCFIIISTASAQSIVGSWTGPIKLPQGDLTFTLNVTGTPGNYKGTADSPMQNSFGMPIDIILFDGQTLRFAIEKLKVKYQGELLHADSIAGDFVQNGATFQLGFRRVGTEGKLVIPKDTPKIDTAEAVKEAEAKPIADSTNTAKATTTSESITDSAAKGSPEIKEAKTASENDISSKIKTIEPILEQVLQNYHAAGYAVAVVNKGGLVYSKGFGLRDVENKKPVTPNTLFPIGSSTKAFTAALVGKLVDEGKIALDSPVTHYLSKLRFYNDELSNKVTLRDMMSHRTGLPRYDISWYSFPTSSGDTLLNRIQYMKPSAELRAQWQYNNFMYLAQGMLVEYLSGKTWEQNIADQIFKPLGMTRSNMTIPALEKDTDASLGYSIVQDSVLKKLAYYNIGAMGPAGSINSSVNEMANWVKLWLNGGVLDGKTILSKDYIADAASSQMVMAKGLPTAEHPDLSFANYGLGWMLSSYRGHYRVEHGGNIDGFSASVSFFPYDGLGIIVLSNQNGSTVPNVVRNLIADKILGLPEYAWSKAPKKGDKKDEDENKGIEDIGRIAGTKPSHILKDYEGTATHPAFGSIQFFAKNDSLFAKLPQTTFWLKHYHYDVFEGRAIDKKTGMADSVAGGMKFNFLTSVDGSISEVTLPLEEAIKEPQSFKFTRNYQVPESELQKYVGDYDLSGMVIKVYIKDKQLHVAVPGQPDYKTIPKGNHKFKPVALEGYIFAFEANDTGEIVAFYSVQPNGTFKAKRK